MPDNQDLRENEATPDQKEIEYQKSLGRKEETFRRHIAEWLG